MEVVKLLMVIIGIEVVSKEDEREKERFPSH